MIEDYIFGSITINGKTYNHDVKVACSGQVWPWQRKESHILDIDSVQENINCDILVVGTGAYGIAKMDKDCKEFIEKKDIKLFIEKTGKAIEIFNNLCQNGDNKAIGLFHVTC